MRIRPSLSMVALLVTALFFTLPAFTAHAASTARLIELNGTTTALPIIEVTGNGAAAVKPDTAYLSLQVETHARTAEEASAKNAVIARKVVEALTAKLAGKGKVSTGGYSLSPQYSRTQNYQPNAEREIVGYTAQNSIMVQTGDLGILGTLIDSAIGAGANRINFLTFGLRNDLKARTEAITDASRNAQTQARALAASLGVKLRRIIKATINPIYTPMAQSEFRPRLAASGTTPVKPGQITVTATVSLTYEIQ